MQTLHAGQEPPLNRPSTKKRRQRTTTSMDVAVRKQVDEELGEDARPLTVGAIRQKYGTASVRIDKRINLPKWKLKWLADRVSINSTLTPEGAWQKRVIEWQKSIPKFMIPRYQQKQELRPQFQRRPHQQTQTPHRRDTREFPRSYGQTPTAIRPS